jgi:hypothetical protein
MKHLCRAIIWSACFLETSDADTVDPDSAVRALEDIASSLQEATEEEKTAFIETCREEAGRLTAEDSASKAAKFITSLPAALGIVEEPEE